jgi:hypothetical protein
MRISLAALMARGLANNPSWNHARKQRLGLLRADPIAGRAEVSYQNAFKIG